MSPRRRPSAALVLLVARRGGRDEAPSSRPCLPLPLEVLMSDPVSSADVVFDFDAANTLITKCRSAATQVTDLSADRAPDVSTAKTDFSGYFSRVFSDNADMETTDATNLSTCLQAVADDVQFLVDTATEENRQRQRARDWDARRAEKWAVEKAVDDLLNIDQRPTSSNGTPPPQEPEAPALQARANPSTGSTSSGGTSSARPDNLRTFATSSQTKNDELTTTLAGLRGADNAFQDGCGWGSLDATSVWNGFQSYLDANANDVTWATTIATAFEEAGTDEGLSTVADSALGAALEAAGVALTRDGLTIEPAQVQGMPLTSGFSDDPVNVATGGFVEVEEDLAFTGGAASLGWSRCYNSTDRGDDDAPHPRQREPGRSQWPDPPPGRVPPFPPAGRHLGARRQPRHGALGTAGHRPRTRRPRPGDVRQLRRRRHQHLRAGSGRGHGRDLHLHQGRGGAVPGVQHRSRPLLETLRRQPGHPQRRSQRLPRPEGLLARADPVVGDGGLPRRPHRRVPLR